MRLLRSIDHVTYIYCSEVTTRCVNQFSLNFKGTLYLKNLYKFTSKGVMVTVFHYTSVTVGVYYNPLKYKRAKLLVLCQFMQWLTVKLTERRLVGKSVTSKSVAELIK